MLPYCLYGYQNMAFSMYYIRVYKYNEARVGLSDVIAKILEGVGSLGRRSVLITTNGE